MTRSDTEAKDVMLEAIEKFKYMLADNLYESVYCRADRLQDLEDVDYLQHDEDMTADMIAENLMFHHEREQEELEEQKSNKESDRLERKEEQRIDMKEYFSNYLDATMKTLEEQTQEILTAHEEDTLREYISNAKDQIKERYVHDTNELIKEEIE